MSGADGDAPKPRKRGRWDSATPSISSTNGSNGVPLSAPPAAHSGTAASIAGSAAALSAKAAIANLGDIKARLAALKAQRAAAAGGAAAQPAAQPSAVAADAPPHQQQHEAAAAAAAARQPGGQSAAPFRAAPLRLDAEGREVDETGKVVERAAATVPSLKINQKKQGPPQKVEPEPELPAIDPGRFLDPEMHVSRGGDRRKRATLQFVKEGKLQRDAEIGRLRAEYGDDAVKAMRKREADERRAAGQQLGDPNQTPLGVKQVEAEPEQQPQEAVPDIEWWDVRICEEGATYDAIAAAAEAAGLGDGFAAAAPLLQGKITNLVQHPVPVQPPAEMPPPPPRPLMLTKKETRKIRKQRREEKEKEKQDLIRQGLLEPPPPKVKISNLMRVLGEEAVMDPTAIEQQVRDQMAERQQAHDDRNEARKLTPAERREKKHAKLVGELGPDTLVAVYRVESLAKPQLRYKVDINAVENHLTGAAIVTDAFCLVVVEGSPKSLKRYGKLMGRRIDWAAVDEDEEAAARAPGEAPRPPNACTLVWEGSVAKPAFQKFSVEVCRTEGAARALLAHREVGHYWDLAQHAGPDDAR